MDAVTSYDTLKDAIAGMLKRDGDVQITSNAALFIQLCEADFPDRIFPREEEYETSLTATINSAVIALPSDYISPIALWLVIDDDRTQLEQVQPQQLRYDDEANQPRVWAIDGENVRFDCTCDSAYTVPFRYRRKTSLSSSNQSNYLMRRRPDLYLYGSLKQAAIFTEDDAAVDKFSALYETALRSFSNAENRNRRPPLRTDLPGCIGGRSNIITGD